MTLRPFDDWIQLRRRGFFLGFALALAASLLTYLRLREFPDPSGLNGYFYLKQIKTLASSGTFYFSDHSLAFLPLAALRWLTGSDLAAFQAGIGIALLALSFGACFFLSRIPGRPWEKEAVKAAVVAVLFSSSFFTEFSLNFFKNLVGAAFLVWCAACLLAGWRRRALLLFLLAFFTHKSVALVAGVYLLLWFAEKIWAAAREQGSRSAFYWASAGLALAGLFLLLFLLYFPKAQAFLAYAQNTFSAPGRRIHWWGELFRNLPQRGAEFFSWIGVLAVVFYARPHLPPTARRIGDAALILFVLAVHPFQAGGPASLGYRQLLLLPALIYPLVGFTLYLPRAGWRLLGLGALLPVFATSFFPLGFSSRAVAKQIRPYSAIRSGVEQIPSVVKPEDHLTSHHGLEFFVDYVTGIRARSFLAAEDFSGRRFRIAFFPSELPPVSPAGKELERIKLLALGRGYFLLKEGDWQALEGKYELPPTWKNGMGRRPLHVYE